MSEITTVAELEAIYGAVGERSLTKEIGHLSATYQAFIEKSPFLVIATVGPEGLDCSPRGDPAGLVRIKDQNTIQLPDRRGNNRIDTLKNIVRDPRVSLLFLIPGIGETMRVNGRAAISTDPELCASFETAGKLPRTVLVITVLQAYFQCQRALVRSRLWEADARPPRAGIPPAGDMLADVSNGEFDGKSYDAGYPEYMKTTIY